MKRTTLWLLVIAAVLSLTCFAPAYAAGDLNSAYQQYSASYKKYVDALNSGASQEQLELLQNEWVTALERYRTLGGKVEDNAKASEKQQAEGQKAAVAEGASQASQNGERPVEGSAGQKRYDAIIAELERKIASKNSGEAVDKLKIELAEQYARLKGDYKKAEALLAEVASTSRNPELVKKANELMKETQYRVKKNAAAEKMMQMKENAKAGYKKFADTKWLALPLKLGRLASYYADTYKYRKAVGDFNDAKKAMEKYTQNIAVTDSTFDNVTDSEPLAGNDVTLLINGKCAFAKRYELAENARNYIYLEYLSYKNDPTGNKLGDILIKKAKEGLDVRVIIDYWTTFDYKKDIVYKLRTGGVKVSLYNSPFKSPVRVNNRNHQKLFIIDDTYGITGGMNIGDDYANGSITVEGWRDTDIMLQGPVVMEMKQLFLDNWATGDNQNLFVRDDKNQKYRDEQEFLSRDFKVDTSTMYKPSENKIIKHEILDEYFTVPPTVRNVDLRFISHFPTNKDDHVLEMMIWYIDRAKKEVILQTPYFLPAKKLEAAIIRASKRGVKVSVITNSMFSNDMGKYIVWASHYFFQDLLENNIKIYEWYNSQTLHAKCNYFDGVAVSIGSYNLNSRSHGLDAEELILVENREFAAIVKDVLDRDLKYCHEVTLDEAKEWRKSFSEKMKMNIFHLVDGIF